MALLILCLTGIAVEPVRSQESDTPAVTIGAGLQTSFLHHQPRGDNSDSSDYVRLNSLRFYVNGSATEHINFMVNTDIQYGGSMGAPKPGQGNAVEVLDAVAQFEFSDKFNVWLGRFLPPSDRSNLYGPFYSHHWAVFADGVQDGYPFVFQGRDNGAMYWGQFDKVKVSLGVFDGLSATNDSTLIGAGRVQVDFWDPEPGYYLNSTFYGDKNILAFGIAAQVQGSNRTAYSGDFLFERKVTGGGAVTLEAEWARYDQLGGYNPNYRTNDGGYLLGSYLFPQKVGPGQFEILGKFAKARFREGVMPVRADYDQNTNEIDLNYVVKQFNARIMFFFKDTNYDAVFSDDFQFGVGLQLQM